MTSVDEREPPLVRRHEHGDQGDEPLGAESCQAVPYTIDDGKRLVAIGV